MKPLLAALAAAAALALPVAAQAGPASITFRSVPTAGERSLSAMSPRRFDLVGLRWHGSGSIRFSVRSADGRWGQWLDAAPDDDRPDPGSPEARASRGWRLGAPTWVGPSNAIRYRISGRVRDVRAAFVRSPELRIPLRTVSSAGSPSIVPRSAWGANEAIVRATPVIAPAIRFASVHHTAGPNGYSRAQVPAILRAIQLYHVRSNGWNDIGYNFLVDRYGTVYEGRGGGIDQNVVGAHIRGFNYGAVGVAMIGTFQISSVPTTAESALERLLAWRLDIAHVDPLTRVDIVSGGSERYRAGKVVTLRAISGHRDTGLTTCPGDRLYARLPAIAAAVARIGLPKIYAPTVTGGLGEPVRFTARLSGPLRWKVSVTDELGQELASGSGRGPDVDWTWDSSLASQATARWQIETPGATAASGTFVRAVPVTALALTALTAKPSSISPNGDGVADSAVVTYTITTPATVEVGLVDASGSLVQELAAPAVEPAGTVSVPFDASTVSDGAYTVVATAIGASGEPVTARAGLVVSRNVTAPSLSPTLLTPNGDGRDDSLSVSFTLATAASVTLRVLQGDAWVATPFSGPLPAGPQVLTWNGTRRSGETPDGPYSAILDVTDEIVTSHVSLPFVLDAHPPQLRLLTGPPRLWVSEPATVTVRVNGALRRLVATQAGPLPLAGITKVTSLVAVARDAADNVAELRRP